MTISVSLAGLLPADLPDGRDAVAEGKASASLDIALAVPAGKGCRVRACLA